MSEKAGNSKGTVRVIGTPFKKGQSGNPSGRPKNRDFGIAVREFLTPERTQKLIQNLFKYDPRTLLAYGFGKPIETHQVQVDGSTVTKHIITIEIAALRDVARKLYGIPEPDHSPEPLHPPGTNSKASILLGNGGS